jgi:hypothetical protein
MADKIGLLSAKAGKKETISSEGGRKRFIKANKAVFKLTHVYFPESSLGLEEENIPSWRELKPLLETLGEVPAPKKRAGTRNSLKYGGTAVQLVVSPPGHKGSVSRFVTKEVMDQLSIQENHFFPYSLDNFDRWYTSIFQGLRHTFPRRLYRLEPWNDSYMHLDNGTPSIAMSDLFETHRLSQEMGTTEVSDMILDEIAQSFKRENELVNKQDDVGVTMQDCDNTIRTLSFDVHHLSLLWECTEHNDLIRKLVLEILYRWKGIVEDTIEDEEQESKVGAGFMHDWKAFMDRPDFRQCDVAEKFFHEGRKYTVIDPKKIVAPGKGMCSNLGQEQGDLQEFCAQYHNHIGYGLDCFRSQPESTKLIPENLDDPKIVKVLLNSVEYRIQDRASYKAMTFDFERMVREKPDWDWPRIRSVEAFVQGPLNLRSDEKRYHLSPSYYELDTVDDNSRYPSHPGYQLTDWTPPDLNLNQPDVYEEPWEAVIKRDIPVNVRNYYEDKRLIAEDEEGEQIYQITAIFFETEDPNWYPPDDWKPDMDASDFSPQEFRAYRRWLWVEEGGDIPWIQVERFRPFEKHAPASTDPFVDRKSKMSVLDILR